MSAGIAAASAPIEPVPAPTASTRPVRVGVSLAFAVVPALAVACTAAGSYATFAIGSTSQWLAAALSLALLAAVGSSALLRNPGAPRIAAPSRAEVVVLGLWLLAVLAICHTTLHWSWFAPVTYSVDAAHHTGIAADLARTWRMAGGFQLTSYPLGPHTVTGLIGGLTGIAMVTTVWWTAIGSVFQSLLLVMVITKNADGRRSWVGTPVALVLALAAWRYTVGVVTWDFFFGMAVSVHLLLAATALLTWGIGARTPVRTWLPAVAILSLALVTTYPQLAPAVPVATVVTLLGRALRDPDRPPHLRRRMLLRSLTALVAVALAGFALLAQTGAMQEIRRSLTVVEEGYAARPSLAVLGGPLAVAAFAVGLVAVTVGVLRGRSNALPLLATFLAVTSVLLLLWVYRSSSGAISSYRVQKVWYALVPLGAIMGGVGIAPLVRAADAAWARRATWAAVVVVALVVCTRPLPMSPTSVPYVGRDEWRLAEWTRRHHDPATVGLAGPGFSPYALWWGALQRPTYGDDMVEDQRIAYWSDWPGGDHDERYLLVVGRRLIASYLERPGVARVRQVGRAALLRRTARAVAQAESDAASGKAEQGAPGL